MTKVKVLIEGCAKEFDNYEKVSPSVVLIETGEFKIIVDPGFNRQRLLEALVKENITTKQVDFIILTHNHLDHCLLAGIFENATILDNTDQYSQDGIIKQQVENILGRDIKIIQTPGHDQFHCSVVIKNEDMGTIVVAGDVFWWLDTNEPVKEYDILLNFNDPYVKNKEDLRNSRKKILEIADYIIPGHGKIFKVNKG
jgi:glyoxylase-like metal-dependent hydrolase (beta-lactamase superfamily II)